MNWTSWDAASLGVPSVVCLNNANSPIAPPSTREMTITRMYRLIHAQSLFIPCLQFFRRVDPGSLRRPRGFSGNNQRQSKPIKEEGQKRAPRGKPRMRAADGVQDGAFFDGPPRRPA